jgi:hypothetical protein
VAASGAGVSVVCMVCRVLLVVCLEYEYGRKVVLLVDWIF